MLGPEITKLATALGQEPENIVHTNGYAHDRVPKHLHGLVYKALAADRNAALNESRPKGAIYPPAAVEPLSAEDLSYARLYTHQVSD